MTESLRAATARGEIPPFLVQTFVKERCDVKRNSASPMASQSTHIIARLFFAIRDGDIRLARFLLEHEANPSRWNSWLDPQPMNSDHDALHMLKKFSLDVAPDEADLKPQMLNDRAQTHSWSLLINKLLSAGSKQWAHRSSRLSLHNKYWKDEKNTELLASNCLSTKTNWRSHVVCAPLCGNFGLYDNPLPRIPQVRHMDFVKMIY
ncbi:hypothetical protein DL96DRAFT_1560976 [Flagelloscypha sp. PMI_526]|nr:hypothetical protein DL96DRAFT_1560976 [Flagelloscypha sp. PMI_526]